MSIRAHRGQVEFSGSEDLSTPGGAPVVVALFDASPGISFGRVVLDEVELESAGGATVTLFLADAYLNLQVVRRVGPGERWIARRMLFGSTWTGGVSVFAAIESVGADTGYARVAGRRV